jgi:ABC-type phosphate transport system substrate-binding protein
VLAAALVLAATIAVPAGAVDNRVQFVRGQGSDSTYDLMQALDRAYNNSDGCQTAPSSGDSPFNSTCLATQPPTVNTKDNFGHDIGISFFPVGSSNGIKILDRFGQPSITKIDYARSSRARNSSSDNTGLRFVAYAQDAVPWVNFREGAGDESSPAAGVDDLTIQEMKDIWVNCSKDNWNEVGGAVDAPILIWTSQPGSGERATFDQFLGTTVSSGTPGGGGTATCIPAEYKDSNPANGERVIFENDSSPIRNCVASNSCPANGWKSSIFHLGFGAWNASPTGPFGKDSGSDLGKIEGVTVSATTINDGTFPARRFVYNVYRASYPSNNIPEAAYDFVSEEGWICKPNTAHGTNPKTGTNYGVEIANTITNTGFLPLPEINITVGTRTFPSKCRVT